MTSDSERRDGLRVLTVSEFKEMIRKGNPPPAEEVDAVTCGTFGVMSGTAAVFSFQAADAGVFHKARSVSLNGVPAMVGPCPNENNGFVDVIVSGTSVSENHKKYGGGHLFKDLVGGCSVAAEIQTDVGVLKKELTINDMNVARLILTRGAFKNYSAFVNLSDVSVPTIFSVLPLLGREKEATVSGCGEINPLQNDPLLRHHRPGTRLLVNGAPGLILGTGTRSTPDKPNLSAAADMFDMDPDLMGGFVTSKGAECLASVASVIPVSDAETYQALQVTDDKIELPVLDVSSRETIAIASYADVWQGTDAEITVFPERCEECTACAASAACPVDALQSSWRISENCTVCLTCTVACPNGVFQADGGQLRDGGKDIPIRLRQSDRRRGEKAAALLKSKIEIGEWVI